MSTNDINILDFSIFEIPEDRYIDELILMNANNILTVGKFEATYLRVKNSPGVNFRMGRYCDVMCEKYLQIVTLSRFVVIGFMTNRVNKELIAQRLYQQLPEMLAISKNISEYIDLLTKHEIAKGIGFNSLHNVFNYSTTLPQCGVSSKLVEYCNSFALVDDKGLYRTSRVRYNSNYEGGFASYVNSGAFLPLLRSMSDYVANMQKAMHVLYTYSPQNMLTTDPEFVLIADRSELSNGLDK